MSTTMESFSTSSTSEARIPLKDLTLNCTAGNRVPSRLLRTPAGDTAGGDHSKAGSSTTDWDRTPTPLHRGYFRKRPNVDGGKARTVTFGEDDRHEGGRLDERKFPWIRLNLQQRTWLAGCAASVRDGDAAEAAAALEDFSFSLMAKLKAEVFLQRPDLINAALHCSVYSSDRTARATAAEAVQRLCVAIMARMDYLEQLHSKGPDGEEDEDEDDRSYDDEIQALTLKSEAISVLELCVVCLGCSAVALGTTESLELVRAAAGVASAAACLGARAGVRASVWERGSTRTTVPLQEMMRDIRTDFRNSLLRHARPSSSSPNQRACVLVVLDAFVSFAEVFLPADSGLLEEVARSVVADKTLFLSHPGLHGRWLRWAAQEERRAWKGPLRDHLVAASRAVVFLNGASAQESAVGDAVSAVRLASLHQSSDCAARIFDLFRRHDSPVDDATKYDLLLSALRNPTCGSDAVLSLHSMVQECLGVARFVRSSSLDSSAILFVFHREEILADVIARALKKERDDSRGAAQEILLYFLKASSDFLDAAVCSTVWNGLRPAMPSLELFCSRKESAAGKLVWDVLSREEAWAGRLSRRDVLAGNMRMMFSRSPEARKKAAVNLKMLLAREPGSHSKLPRFSSIVDADVSDVFVNVRTATVNFRSAAADGEEFPLDGLIRTMESLSSDPVSRPAWATLEAALQDRAAADKFLEMEGLALLERAAEELLSEERSCAPVAAKFLQRWIATVKAVVAGMREEAEDGLLFLLLRCALFPWEDPAVRADLASVWFAVLFRSQIVVREGRPHLPVLVTANVVVPIDCIKEEEEDDNDSCDDESTLDGRYDDVIKTFWNVSYFGGADPCLDEERTAGGKFSRRLKLTSADRSAVRDSFLVPVSSEAAAKLERAAGHAEFREALHFASCHLGLSCREEDFDRDALKRLIPSKTLSRFFVKSPRSERDRTTLLAVMDFLARAVPHFDAQDLVWLADRCRDFGAVLLFKESDGVLTAKEADVVFDLLKALKLKFGDLLTRVPGELRPVSLLDRRETGLVLKLGFPGNHDLLGDLTPQDVKNLMQDLAKVKEEEQAFAANVLVMLNEVIAARRGHDELASEVEVNCRTLVEVWDGGGLGDAAGVLALLATAEMASYKRGAAAVASCPHVWQKLLGAAFGVAGVGTAKERAFRVMCSLLSTSDDDDWFGPLAVETITGRAVVGEAALGVFARDNGLFESLLGLMRATDGDPATLTGALELVTLLLESGARHTLVGDIVDCGIGKLEDVRERLGGVDGEGWMGYLVAVLQLGSVLLICQDNKKLMTDKSMVRLMSAAAFCADRAPTESTDDLTSAACDFATRALMKLSGTTTTDAATAELVGKYSARLLEVTVEQEGADVGHLFNLAAACSVYAVREPRGEFRQRLERVGGKEEKAASLGARTAARIMGHLALWPENKPSSDSAETRSALAALKFLFLASPSSQTTALDADMTKKVELLMKSAVQMNSLPSLDAALVLANNLCFNNTRAKQEVASGVVPALILRTLSRWGHPSYPRSRLLVFAETGSAGCPAFSSALCKVRPFSASVSRPRDQPLSLLHFLVDRCKVDPQQELPACARTLMALAVNPEGKRVICRSGLLQHLLQWRNRKRKSQLDAPFLDLLISLTTTPEGQAMAQQVRGLEDHLLEAAAGGRRDARLASLAALRNLALRPEAARRMAKSEDVAASILVGLTSSDAETVSATMQLCLAVSTAAAGSGGDAAQVLRELGVREVLDRVLLKRSRTVEGRKVEAMVIRRLDGILST